MYGMDVYAGAGEARYQCRAGHSPLQLAMAQFECMASTGNVSLMQDNGCGMAHKDIPSMLGRVLSGTKYGVKQTRGKFGLGAKVKMMKSMWV